MGCEKARVCVYRVFMSVCAVPWFDHRSMAPQWGRLWYYRSYRGGEKEREERGMMKSWLLFSNEPYMRSSLFTIHPPSRTRSPLCKRETDGGWGWGQGTAGLYKDTWNTVWNASYALTLIHAHSAHAIYINIDFPSTHAVCSSYRQWLRETKTIPPINVHFKISQFLLNLLYKKNTLSQ